jgi:multiple sugar transport system ATP-binding protein
MIYVTHDQIEAMTLGQCIVVLDAGVIQQIDTPMRLCEKPANLFVAGFFGSPAMNFFRGVLSDTRGLRLDLGDAGLPLGDLSLTQRGLEGYAGREIVLDLRPDNPCIAPDGAGERSAERGFPARLDYVEPVGNEVSLNVQFGDRDLVGRLPPRSLPPPGSLVRAGLSPANLHCSDPRSGVRIGAD